MAINAYTGLMGSGKTYEVVLSVVLPAIKSGRDVVTNIRGLQYDLICAHLKEPAEGREFGKIRVVNNLDVEGGDFFPVYNDKDQKFEYTEKTVVQPGDLVAIDEAWRPWGTDSKCVKAHMSFFREHRQCVNAHGASCDLAIITQDIADIHPRLKSVVEMSLRFSKLKSLGLTNRYRVEIYEGAKLFKSKMVTWNTRTYEKAIFPLYKSYASESGTGVEKVIDARQNIFKSGAFVLPIVLALAFIGGAIWFLYGVVLGKDEPQSVEQLEVSENAKKDSPAAPVSKANNQNAPIAPPVMGAGASYSATVISGSITIAGDSWAVLSSPEGLSIASPSMIYSRGVSAITKDENKSIPSYFKK